MRTGYKMATLFQAKHFGFFFQIVFELCLCLFDSSMCFVPIFGMYAQNWLIFFLLISPSFPLC